MASQTENQGRNQKRRVLVVVMDGIGLREETFGNAVALAPTPVLDCLRKEALFTTLNAHGTAVGLPSDADIGNSEVGHNAIGAGRIFDQGAKLVQNALDSGELYRGHTWQEMMTAIKARPERNTLHFIGLLSDGNVHANDLHLHMMLAQAKKEGVQRVRVHVLFDGRDVGEKSAEKYVERLEKVMAELRSSDYDVRVASGGGRMHITMDRYEADWPMVARGWETHVHGVAQHKFKSLPAALAEFRKTTKITDQYLPTFVLTDGDDKPVGMIEDGDAVVFFNFRGDRAIEISRAFTEDDFKAFDRGRRPRVFYAGMMQYDGDKRIPPRFLVTPPAIKGTLTEYLLMHRIRQFACSETQKFGHVTYFWNGNRSGYIDQSLEEYVEVPSDDDVTFDEKPWMKAYEITKVTIDRMRRGTFDFGRINFANGDMVGHMGNLEAAIVSVATVDMMLGKLVQAADETDTILLVTADHGNAEEMFEGKEKDYPGGYDHRNRPKPKTAHTLNPVPFVIYDPRCVRGVKTWKLADVPKRTLANLASTAIMLLGLPENKEYMPSLVQPI